MKPIRVLIVDDSPMMRTVLAQAIGNATGFEVVGMAHNAADALEKINTEGPDVVTLDVELPDMNGIELLERIMEGRAPAVVMVSGLTRSGAQTSLRALQLGAVDFIGKPDASTAENRVPWANELVDKLRRAATLRPVKFEPSAPVRPPKQPKPDESSVNLSQAFDGKVVVIGAGSAATDTLNRLLVQLPRDCPPVLIAQQLSPVVIEALVSMLKRRVNVEIQIATDGAVLKTGCVIMGRGDVHVSVTSRGRDRCVRLTPGDPIRGYLPSIDFLFETASLQLGADAIGILLDAANDDGEAGLKQLAAKHARVMRQVRDRRRTVERQAVVTASLGDVPVLTVEQILGALSLNG